MFANNNLVKVIAAYIIFFGPASLVLAHELMINQQTCGQYKTWLAWDKDAEVMQEQYGLCLNQEARK